MIKRSKILKELNMTINSIRFLEKELNIQSKNLNDRYYTELELQLILKEIEKYKLPKDAKLISGSHDYVTPSGKIYKQKYKDSCLYYEPKQFKNTKNGYLYCRIKMLNGRRISKRVNVLVAKAFVANPNNYNVVGHKDNNKTNNNYNNLYWTTISENTKKAYYDGLAKNNKGYANSKSIEVIQYDNNTHMEINRFRSIGEASRHLNIPQSTIINQCKNKAFPRKYNFYTRYAK